MSNEERKGLMESFNALVKIRPVPDFLDLLDGIADEMKRLGVIAGRKGLDDAKNLIINWKVEEGHLGRAARSWLPSALHDDVLDVIRQAEIDLSWELIGVGEAG